MKKSAKPIRRAIIVLGMHRSGTSALTRVINMLGVYLGDRLWPPGPIDSQKGFCEHKDIYHANEKLLHDLNSAWDDVRSLPDGWWNSDVAQRYKLEIINVLERDFSESRFWGVKDPRACRFLPVWRPLLEQADIKPHFVIIVRNPLEVVASLAKRDGFSKGKSCLLWLKHLIESEKGTRKAPRVFVTYEELLSDWKGVMSRVQKSFRFRWPITLKKAGPDIDSFLEVSLRHNRITDTVLIEDEDLSKWIKDAYLAATATVGEGDGLLIKTIDRIETELNEADSLYEPVLTDLWEKYRTRDKMLQERNQQIGEISLRLEEFSQDKGYHLSSIDHLQTEIKEKDEQIQKLNSEIVALRDQLSEVQQTLSGRETEAVRLETGIKVRDERIQQLDAELTGLRGELASSRRDVSKTETRFATLQSKFKEKEERIQKLESEIVTLSDQLSEVRQTLAGRETEVVRLETGIKDRDERIQQLDAQLTGLRGELASSRRDLSKTETRLANLQSELKEKDEIIEQLDAELVHLKKEVTASQQALVKHETKTNHLESGIKERDEKIQRLESEGAGLREALYTTQKEVVEREKEINQIQAIVKEKDQQINSLNTDLKRFQDEVESLQKQIETYNLDRKAILDSASWKLTAPLRWMFMTVRKLKR